MFNDLKFYVVGHLNTCPSKETVLAATDCLSCAEALIEKMVVEYADGNWFDYTIVEM